VPGEPKPTDVLPPWRTREGALILLFLAAVAVVIWNPAAPRVVRTFTEDPASEAVEVDGAEVPGGARGFDLRVRVRDRGVVRWVAPNGTVAPGDRIELVAFPRREGWLLVLGRDAAGRPFSAYPRQGTQAIRLPRSDGERALGSTITVGSEPGALTLLAVYCAEVFEAPAVEGALGGAALPDRDGCEQELFSLHVRGGDEVEGETEAEEDDAAAPRPPDVQPGPEGEVPE
jgi:hypothetical protein